MTFVVGKQWGDQLVHPCCRGSLHRSVRRRAFTGIKNLTFEVFFVVFLAPSTIVDLGLQVEVL